MSLNAARLFWKVRLGFQSILGAIARPLGFNDKLTQFCDRCGTGGAWWPFSWWAVDIKLWEKVAGNVNNCHHGCYCPRCFTSLAREKGIGIDWIPTERVGEPKP